MASTVRIGDLTVNRLGFGAMRLCGTNIWGPLLQADRQSGGVAPTVSTAGFPDSMVRESRCRVRAIRNSGLAIPVAPITVSLTPTC